MSPTPANRDRESVDRRTFLLKGGRLLGGAALLGVAGPALVDAGVSCHPTW